jgi:hypothetical protein
MPHILEELKRATGYFLQEEGLLKKGKRLFIWAKIPWEEEGLLE